MVDFHVPGAETERDGESERDFGELPHAALAVVGMVIYISLCLKALTLSC